MPPGDPHEVAAFVRERSAAWPLVAAPEASGPVETRPLGSVWLASIGSNDHARRFVVKPLAGRCVLGDAQRLQTTHETVRQAWTHPHALPPILDADPHRQWIVMPFVEGASLESLIVQALHRRTPTDRVDQTIHAAGQLLGSLCDLSAATIGLEPARVCNRAYVPEALRAWRSPLMQWVRWRTGIADWSNTPDHIEAFARRTCDRLLPVDAQPKNLIVGHEGQLTVIDPDYAAGNPALTLAHVLLNLDRIAMRHPLRHRLIERWKWQFTQAFTAGRPEITHDAAVLYPWAVVRVYEDHQRARPMLSPLLFAGYARGLARFLPHLSQSSAPSHHRASAGCRWATAASASQA